MLPVVSKDGQRVWNALRWVLHLQLHRILLIIHFFVILMLLYGKDAFLSIWLLGVNRENHIVGNECLLWLSAGLVQDAKIVPNFPKLVF